MKVKELKTILSSVFDNMEVVFMLGNVVVEPYIICDNLGVGNDLIIKIQPNA